MGTATTQLSRAITRGLHHSTSRRRILAGSAAVSGAAALTLTEAGAGAATATSPGGLRVAAAQNDMPELDPQMQEVIDALVAFDVPPIEDLTPHQARNASSFADAVQAVLTERGEPAIEPVGDISHILIPGPEEDLLARVYTPEGEGPFPVLMYFHGGGFVIANLNTYDAAPRALANAAGCVVVSVAYRQAPENPYPAAIDDAYAATQYILDDPSVVNGIEGQVAVAGESAGGNLATVVCLRAREDGGSMPVHQLLVYPVTTFAPEGEETESIEEHSDAVPLNEAMLEWFGGHYLPDDDAASDPYVSPIMADSLSDLPPATVITAEVDPLRSQGRLYAERLEEEGVSTTYTNYEGVTHEFFGMGAVVDIAAEAVNQAAEELEAAFEGTNS